MAVFNLEDVKNVLLKTMTGDNEKLKTANDWLESALRHDSGAFLQTLADILQDVSGNQSIRLAAGLNLKNALVARDVVLREEKTQRWLAIDQASRDHIKNQVFNTLGTEPGIRVAPACVAQIAVIEIPKQLWDGVLTQLSILAISNEDESKKEAALECIGFICEDLPSHYIANCTNELLSAIINTMVSVNSGDRVIIAATKALKEATYLISGNMDVVEERNHIMNAVCSIIGRSNVTLQVVALQCLIRIVTIHYSSMKDYMENLAQISLGAIQDKNNEIAMQGLEFWTSLAEEEFQLAVNAATSDEAPKVENYCQLALHIITPLVLESLTRREENDDDDEWTVSKAATTCLMRVSECVGDTAAQKVIPFVAGNIKDENPRRREAAALAFGSVLDGPDWLQNKDVISEALSFMIQLMHDKDMKVRDTAVWVIGRICELCRDAVLNEHYFKSVCSSLRDNFKSSPHVAVNVCCAIQSLSQACYSWATLNQCKDGVTTPDWSPLSSILLDLVQDLVQLINQYEGTSETNLVNAAYETMCIVIEHTCSDTYDVVLHAITYALDQITGILEKLDMRSGEKTSHDLTEDNCLGNRLRNILPILHAALQKIKKEDVKAQQFDNIIEVLFRCLFYATLGIEPECILCLTSCVELTETNDYVKYLPKTLELINWALSVDKDNSIASITAGIISEICKTGLGELIKPDLPEILRKLLELICKTNDESGITTVCLIGTIGDIAHLLGREFIQYIHTTLQTLHKVSGGDQTRKENEELLSEVREACLEVYSIVVSAISCGLPGNAGSQGTMGPQGSQEVKNILENHVQIFVKTAELILNESIPSEVGLKAGAGLVADLASIYGKPIIDLMSTSPNLIRCLEKTRKNKQLTKNTRQCCAYALRTIKQQGGGSLLANQCDRLANNDQIRS